MPMSASAVINRAEFLEALDRLETTYLAATTESHALVKHRESVIQEAERAAEEIVRQAQLEEDRLVSDTEVFRLAQRRAEEMQAAAQADSDALRADCDAYIEQRFANFEHALERTLAEVRRGIANLVRPQRLRRADGVLRGRPGRRFAGEARSRVNSRRSVVPEHGK